MNKILKTLSVFLGILFLSVGLAAETISSRYDGDIQSRVSQQLAAKKEFRNLHAATEDGIVTLTGTVDMYQQKLDAAKKVRKTEKVQGVRNLIEVSSNVPDAQLAAQLDRKLYFDRIGYDNEFNFVTVAVKDGVTTVSGETRTDVGRDSALALVNNTPGGRSRSLMTTFGFAPCGQSTTTMCLAATRQIRQRPFGSWLVMANSAYTARLKVRWTNNLPACAQTRSPACSACRTT